tara:strand:- start:222 stop:962 length:741 start_codon:yes stop_codon:yes gene_type:complete
VDTFQNLAKGKPSDYHHLIVKRRLRIIESFDRFYDKNSDLLEMGCGNGASLSLIHKRFNSCHGIDISKKYLKQFQDVILKNRITNCTFSCSDIEEGSSVDKKFDRIICFEVLEHVKDDTHALKIMFKKLKPNSKIAISIPNKWWIFETHGAHLPLLPWNRVPFFSWLPKSIHGKYAKAKNYEANEMRNLLTKVGFKIVDIKYINAPMDMVPFKFIQNILRSTIFKNDTTNIPFLSTSIMLFAEKPN